MHLSRTAALAVVAALAAAPAPAASPPGDAPDLRPRYEISVSYVANLVHWVDNLAGASGGKTIRTYRRYWQERFGPPTRQEMELLHRWRALRVAGDPAPQGDPVNAAGCLPQVEERPGRRQRFLLASYDAPSVQAFLQALRESFTAEEVEDAGHALKAYEPRFATVWKEMTFLGRFEDRFRRFLEEGELRPLLARVARFMEVDPSREPPGRIHLMALPLEGATTATAIGRDLMMEIRPGDGPAQQVQVIAHETAHYFWRMIPPERLDRIAAAVHAASPEGPVAWALLHEGLPTAIGQGLADARLVPERFGMRFTWYHIPAIDRFAKSIYPEVERAVRRGGSFEKEVAPGVGRGASALEGDLPPVRFLEEGAHLLGEGTFPAYRRILLEAPVRHRWLFPAASPELPGFLDRYTCLGGLALVGPAEASDPSRLPALVREALAPVTADAEAAPGRDGRAAAPPLRSGVLAVRRPGGGLLFALVAARSEDLIPVADLFLGMERVPAGPVWLHASPEQAPPAGGDARGTSGAPRTLANK